MAGQPQPHTLTSSETQAPGETPTYNAYEYDATGNTTERQVGGVLQNLTWDPEGHLSNVAEGDQNTSFLYSADGDRLIRRDAEGTTLYLPGMEVHAATPTSMPTAKRYYSHGGATVAMRDATSLHWFVADHHGTNQVAINATTEAVERRYSTPFGGDRGAAPGLWPDDKGFVGGTEDDTGLTHLGAREYDPELGRFISVDPVMDPSDPQQMNGYSYSNNNPTTWSDPSGLLMSDEDGSGGTVVTPSIPAGAPVGEEVLSEQDRKDLEEAKKAKKKSLLDVIKEQGLAFLLDFFGITDIINCFTKGDVGACVNTLINLIPWGKVFKAGKAIYHGIKNAFKAYKTWQKAIRWADDVIRRTDELIALAQKKADEAAQALADRLRKQADDQPGGSCPLRNSFVPGTLVLMADGTRKPIEDIKLGEQVLATDPETGETGARQVDRLITGTGIKHLVTVTIDTDGPAGGQTASVTATDGHPFWSPELHLWIDAAALQPGQYLRTAAGTWVQITAITHHATVQAVHNLTIHDIHTYYVVAGDAYILSHNCDNEKPRKARTEAEDEDTKRKRIAEEEDAGEGGRRSERIRDTYAATKNLGNIANAAPGVQATTPPGAPAIGNAGLAGSSVAMLIPATLMTIYAGKRIISLIRGKWGRRGSR